ncbi:MAG: DUF4079 domain-containing protein [Myxacorys chilensis ATA2-1-KO14]|jgi:multidrug transporter EmrE-like cation transporter|nr:DUF4079 domain-containing protein [Myxacorys chilensis ATA2-1-KO14]
MNKDLLLLLHPLFAIAVVFPMIGIVVHRGLQVRQRRLKTPSDGKSKIPPVVGQEHVQIGRWLTGSVVVAVLLALAHDIVSNVVETQRWSTAPLKVLFVGLMFIATIASFVLLYQAKQKQWRAIFATLTGMGLVVLGCQEGVYRKTDQWYVSHYYYGMTAALLMIFALAIVQSIYQDKKNHWRTVHIVLNGVALLLFFGQGFTGTQALLEVPLSWQEPYVQKLYELQCEQKPCTVQPSVPQATP